MATKVANQASGNGKKAATRPVWSKRFWPVNVAVFEFTSEDGRLNHSVEVSRSFRRDEESEWEKSTYLTASDLLPAAKLLEEAYAIIQERIQESISSRGDKSSNSNESRAF